MNYAVQQYSHECHAYHESYHAYISITCTGIHHMLSISVFQTQCFSSLNTAHSLLCREVVGHRAPLPRAAQTQCRRCLMTSKPSSARHTHLLTRSVSGAGHAETAILEYVLFIWKSAPMHAFTNRYTCAGDPSSLV